MPRPKESSFVVQFPLDTEIFQDDILNKRLEIARNIYNALVKLTLNRYGEMIKTKAYREAVLHLATIDTDDKNARKPYCDILNRLREEYGINEYAFHADVKDMQRHFKDNVDSFTAQKIATRLWAAYNKMIFGNGEAVHYKKFGEFNSVEGKSNNTGIRFADGFLLWNGLKISVKIDSKNQYEVSAFDNKIAYCRIVRRFVRGKYKFYVQIVFKGAPPLKINKKTGLPKHTLGCGDVGMDIGTQTLAWSAQNSVGITELADRVQNIEDEKRRVLRRMDRSRRATNPDNFNPDGTVKKQGRKKVKWNRSKRYIKARSRLAELSRRQATLRKLQHETLANRLLGMGDSFFVETMNFSGLAKRAKKTEKNDKGKFKRKKRFGKSIANKAPACCLPFWKEN